MRSHNVSSAFAVLRPGSIHGARLLGATKTWILFLLLLPPFSLHGQIASGRLTGTVKDASGAVVGGAKLTLTKTTTAVVTTITSMPTGTYVFEAQSPGVYTLQVTAPGFKSF